MANSGRESSRWPRFLTGLGRPEGRRRRALVILVAAALVLAVTVALIGRGSDRRGGQATIRIPPGTSSAGIARLLKDADVIDDEGDFLKQAGDSGVAGSLQAGTYTFTRGEPVSAILDKLKNGQQDSQAIVTVPEGYSLKQIATVISGKTGITSQQYESAAVPDGRTLPLAGAGKATNLEGFLFPSTYDLTPGLTAPALVDEQLKRFSESTASLPWSHAADRGLTPYQALIVASMIEREAKVPEERPEVAAVIYNRLAKGMKLQVDATVQYALGYWKQDLTQSDLETDSPYNTRLYAGLPPGPICNPGLASIKAALDPAPVDYLYYVATGDAAGHHFFTASYDEFLRVKNGGKP